MYNIVIESTQDELVIIGLALADGSMSDEKLFMWLCNHYS